MALQAMIACRHDYGFEGMRRVGNDADTVYFACDSCEAACDAPRCSATAAKTGERCLGTARTDDTYCYWHGW